MKNTKTTIISAVMLLATFVAFGQERINREALSFIDTTEYLTTATGWSYNETLGKWIDFENVISNDIAYKEKYPSLQGRHQMSGEDQNFTSIQTRTVIHNETKYYVMMVTKWDGAYEYPTIRKNWYTYSELHAFIFTEEEYSKLHDLNDSTVSSIYLETQHLVEIRRAYTEESLLAQIQTKLDKGTSYGKYTFPIIRAESGEIRFYVPGYFPTSQYAAGDKIDFNKAYFETTLDNFSKFIIQ